MRQAKPPGQFSTTGDIQLQYDTFQYSRHLRSLPGVSKKTHWFPQSPRHLVHFSANCKTLGQHHCWSPAKNLCRPLVCQLLLQINGSGEFPSSKPDTRYPAAFSARGKAPQPPVASHSAQAALRPFPALPMTKTLASRKLPFMLPHPFDGMRAWLWGGQRIPGGCGIQFTRRPDWEASVSLRMRYLMQKSPRTERGWEG